MLLYGCLIAHIITFYGDSDKDEAVEIYDTIETKILETIQTTTIEEIRSQVINSICSLVIS